MTDTRSSNLHSPAPSDHSSTLSDCESDPEVLTQKPSTALSDERIPDALAQSLIAFSYHPNCPASPGYFTNVPVHDQPRRLSSMPDNADYFVFDDGSPLRMVFPAELDLEGKYSRTGLYFNLPQSFDVRILQRTRAQFELRMLDTADCPIEAVRASRAAYDAMVALEGEVETKRNGTLLATKHPALTSFWRTYQGADDHYTLVVQTDLIFRDVPDLNNAPVPKLSRSQVGLFATPPSPSKLNKPSTSKTSTVSDTPSLPRGIHGWKLRDLADPEGRYSRLPINCQNVTTIHVPDVRDRNGSLIHPQDYSSKLEHGCKVGVEVILKLWNFGAPDKAKLQPSTPAKWKPREGEENGSRIYQLILTKLQVLPAADISKNVFASKLSSAAGKRKASVSDHEDSVKRRAVDDMDLF